MYTLYYISESLQISTIQVETLDQDIIIPENLHFISLRKGINFINEPSECINFTDLERLAIAQRLDDLNLFKNHSFRLKNSKFSPLCQIDPKPKLNFDFVLDIDTDETPSLVLRSDTNEVIHTFFSSGSIQLEFLEYYKYEFEATSGNLDVNKILQFYQNGVWSEPANQFEFMEFISFTESIYPNNATKIRLTLQLKTPYNYAPIFVQNEWMYQIYFQYPLGVSFDNIVLDFFNDTTYQTFTTQPVSFYRNNNINGEDTPRYFDGATPQDVSNFDTYRFPELVVDGSFNRFNKVKFRNTLTGLSSQNYDIPFYTNPV